MSILTETEPSLSVNSLRIKKWLFFFLFAFLFTEMITAIAGGNKTVRIPITVINNTSAATDLQQQIDIYPNPSNGKQLNINLGDYQGATTVKVIDTNGKTLIEHVAVNQQVLQFGINLLAGIYLVQLINKQSSIIKKLVVEK